MSSALQLYVSLSEQNCLTPSTQQNMPIKAVDFGEKLKNLPSLNNSPSYENINNKIEDLSKSIKILQANQNASCKNLFTGFGLGLAGGMSTSFFILNCLAACTPPNALALSTILIASVVGTIFGVVIGNCATINTISKNKNQLISENKKLTDYITKNKETILEQLKNTEHELLTKLNYLDGTNFPLMIYYTTPTQNNDNSKEIQKIKAHLNKIDDAITILKNIESTGCSSGLFY